LFAARPRTTTVGGLDYAYVDEGCGPPVVLVHGNPSWSFLFRSLVERLPATGHRAVAPDHIGMGRSAKPTRATYPHTLARRVADFTEFMAEVVPEESVTLVVHDWGGAIALAWAVAHPERIAGLVLLNTAAFPLPAGKRLPLPLRATRTRLGTLAVLYGNAFAVGAALLGVRRRMPAPVRRGYLAPYDRPSRRVAVLEFVRDIPLRSGDPAYGVLRDTEQRLGVLRDRPVLICWGMRDFVLDEDILRRWQEIYPDAEVHRFADAGHYVLEDATEAIGQLVESFLERTSTSAPAGSR
jgi:haloalkane dehalogenase